MCIANKYIVQGWLRDLSFLRGFSGVNEKRRKVGYVDVGLRPAVDKQSKESVTHQDEGR